MKQGRLLLLNKCVYRLFTVVFVILVFLLCCELIFAAGEGTTGARTLETILSARASGMGSVFTGIADDAGAIYFNPAGLSQINSNEISFVYNQGIAEVKTNSVNFIYSKNKLHKFGLGVLLFDGGTADIFYEDGSTKKIKAQQDSLVVFSYSPEFSRDGSLGINLKTLNAVLAEKYSGSAFAIDIGMLLKSGDGSNLGIALQNIDVFNRGIKYIDVADKLPTTIRMGGSSKTFILKKQIIIGADIIKPYYGNSWKMHIGGELSLGKNLQWRIGYKYGYDFLFLSGGIGLRVGGFNLDIGTNIIGNWGIDNQASLSVRF